ncbi:MAG: CmcI family methyltransferase [Pseudomonadota bacterium]
MTDDPAAAFQREKAERIARTAGDTAFRDLSAAWTKAAFERLYMYNFEAHGRPVIQLPCDVLALSEVIWQVRPDLIVETGIAHGGSVVHSAAALALLDLAEATERGAMLDPAAPSRKVVAVDIDIRAHNRAALDAHPFRNRMVLIEGSSLDPAVTAQVSALVTAAQTVLVILDSNHTHAHVLDELRAYAPLVSRGSYCVVFDTVIEHLPRDFFANRPWNLGDSPATAIAAFQDECRAQSLVGIDGAPLTLELDTTIDAKLMTSAAPGGFLRRT